MKGNTHLLGGIVTAGTLALLSNIETPSFYQAILSVACIAGSLFPDIDLPNSKAGTKTLGLSHLINRVFGHRTFFHSPMLVICILSLTQLFAPQWTQIAMAFSAGICSHLFLDMFNKSGIPLFWPHKKHFHLASLKLGGLGEDLIAVLLLLTVAAESYMLFL